MTIKVSLSTTQAELEHLHNKTNNRALGVKILREALEHLLLDHARLCKALTESTSHVLVEPARVRVRERRS
jgi:ATP-dependent protease Clp ATPase subunit